MHNNGMRNIAIIAQVDHGKTNLVDFMFVFFFFKQKTAYEMAQCDWIQTCALPICRTSTSSSSACSTRGTATPRRGRTTKIGRASCRERLSRVDLGGRRIIKKKKNTQSNNKKYKLNYNRSTDCEKK